MGDYSSSKPRITSAYPFAATKGGASGFTRVEEFLSPERLKNEFLFGIPLVSLITHQTMSDDTIKAIIRRAAADVEMECGIDIFRTQRVKRLDFDHTKYYQGWGQIDVGFPNIKSIEEMSIRTVESISTENPTPPAGMEDGKLIYKLPLAWLDIDSYGYRGLIHMVPLQTAFSGTGFGGTSNTYSGAAATILAVFNQLRWVPSFWYCKFTTGFEDNSIPSPVNQLIGYKAAREILSQLAITFRYTSKSIGIDSTSQSLAGPGYQLFALRIAELDAEIAKLTEMIRKYFHNTIIMTNV